MGRSSGILVLILACLWLCPARGFSWNIFSSFSASPPPPPRAPAMELDGTVADFSMDGANDPRGVKLLEDARSMLSRPKNCWQDAYRRLFASCGDIMSDKEKQSRLAWHLSSCFQEDSSRPPFPSCGENSLMVHCCKKLGDYEFKVYLEFFLQTNTLCHQLQAEAFKHSTERLINDLSRSSKSVEEKLEVIEERSEQIVRESGKVQDTLSSIETQADRLAETSKHVGDQIGDVLARSMAISEQTKEIAASQRELREGQDEVRESIADGMVHLQESYESLGSGMEKLKEDAAGIQREIVAVGDSMSSKMKDLQSTADDIGSVAGKSLENQMQLLDGQSKAMQGLNDLYNVQTQALDESRETIQKLAQFGQRQLEELMAKQDQIRDAHDHLIQNSHSILEAQEEFRAKQANIFTALDKLYILHNAILAESRFIKAFFFYCCIVFLIYMLTSARQTFRIRGPLYFSLCVTLLLEIGLIKLGADDIDKQFWVISKVSLVRMTFLAAAAVQMLHAIFTYRDYELLNHRLLQTLVEKVRALEENVGGGMPSFSMMSGGGGSDDGESLTDYSWVFDELPEEVDSKADPSYTLPERACGKPYDYTLEKVAENSSMTSISWKYNLRPRK